MFFVCHVVYQKRSSLTSQKREFIEQRTRKGPEIKLPLEVTLEELFSGKVLEVGCLSFVAYICKAHTGDWGNRLI